MQGKGYFSIVGHFIDQNLRVNNDVIRVNNGAEWNLRLCRYFKNDWQGVVTQLHYSYGSLDAATEVYAIDCRHNLDKITQISEYFEKVHLINNW